MSEKEKQTLNGISQAVSGMTEVEKARFLGIAEGMSIMKDMNQKTMRGTKRQASRRRQGGEENAFWPET